MNLIRSIYRIAAGPGRCAALTIFCLGSSIAPATAQENSLRSTEPPAVLRAVATETARPIKASAESPIVSSKSAQLMLQDASQKSKVAVDQQDFSEIITLCERAHDKTLSAEEASYARDLTAWAFNKRGECRSSEAAEYAAAGSESEAAKRERLAIADFSAALKLQPNRWKTVHNRAVSHGILGASDQAIADFQLVVKLKPDAVDDWFNLAEVRREAGHFADAVRDYTHVLELNGSDASAYRGRGLALLERGKTHDSIADFNRSLELKPEDTRCLIARGQAFARLQEWRDAGTDFRTAIEIDDACAAAYREAAWLMATCPQAKYRNSRAAIEGAEQAIALAENQGAIDFTYHDTLAAALANAGRFVDARKSLDIARQSAPPQQLRSLQQRQQDYAHRRPYRTTEDVVANAPRNSSER